MIGKNQEEKNSNKNNDKNPGKTSINFSDETWRRFFVMALLAGGACSYRDVVRHAGEVLKILEETKGRS